MASEVSLRHKSNLVTGSLENSAMSCAAAIVTGVKGEWEKAISFCGLGD